MHFGKSLFVSTKYRHDDELHLGVVLQVENVHKSHEMNYSEATHRM